MSEKEKINQLKAYLEEFRCSNKDIERGFVGGLYYAIMLLEHGKEYADHKIDWDALNNDPGKYEIPEKMAALRHKYELRLQHLQDDFPEREKWGHGDYDQHEMSMIRQFLDEMNA